MNPYNDKLIGSQGLKVGVQFKSVFNEVAEEVLDFTDNGIDERGVAHSSKTALLKLFARISSRKPSEDAYGRSLYSQ